MAWHGGRSSAVVAQSYPVVQQPREVVVVVAAVAVWIVVPVGPVVAPIICVVRDRVIAEFAVPSVVH